MKKDMANNVNISALFSGHSGSFYQPAFSSPRVRSEGYSGGVEGKRDIMERTENDPKLNYEKEYEKAEENRRHAQEKREEKEQKRGGDKKRKLMLKMLQ